MSNEKTSTMSNALLWFGAAVSIAEILTGTLIAPLGLTKGLAAIVLGHLIGCVLLYFAGIIGGESGLAAIESSGISFGKYGSYIFAVFNILQLVGWTAVMIITASSSFNQVIEPITGCSNIMLWSILIGVLIIAWVLIGVKNLGKVNVFAVGGLFVLTVVLSAVVFRPAAASALQGDMTFGMAVELSVAMPLSWLPLISDYTRYAKKPKSATFVSSLAYFIGSSWMFAIGMCATLYTGLSDIAQILLKAGLGVAALIIVVMSTVTTTFLDVFSAGVSSLNISKRFNEKHYAVAACIVGTVIAMFTPIEQYENFLYLIGSIFTPMSAILISDYFIFKKRNVTDKLNIVNTALWLVGFIIYRVFLKIDTVVGSTVPVILIIIILSITVNGGIKLCSKKS